MFILPLDTNKRKKYTLTDPLLRVDRAGLDALIIKGCTDFIGAILKVFDAKKQGLSWTPPCTAEMKKVSSGLEVTTDDVNMGSFPTKMLRRDAFDYLLLQTDSDMTFARQMLDLVVHNYVAKVAKIKK